MNLHAISEFNLPLLQRYLEHLHGWEWRRHPTEPTLQFRTTSRDEWIALSQADLTFYEPEADSWQAQRRPDA